MSTNNQSDKIAKPAYQKDWVAAYFRSADCGDIDALAKWFADDIDFRFANMPPVSGKQRVREGIGGFLKTIKAMRHEPSSLVESGDTAAQQATVFYTTFDDQTIALPVSTYMRRNDQGLLDRVWIYMDLGPLLAATGDHS